MAILRMILIIMLSGCQMEHSVEPIQVQLCIDDWLYDLNGEPLLNDIGGQLECRL